MPGPPPTPTKTLEARGSWRAKTRSAEPASDGVLPECPAVLAGEARREWERALSNLDRMGILDQFDMALVSGYCMAWARLVKAESRSTVLERQQMAAEKNLRRAKKPDARKQSLAECSRLDRLIWKCEVSWGRCYNALIKAADRLGIGASARARAHADKTEPKETGPRLSDFRLA